VSALVSGLAPHTTYYYQLFASNAGGSAASSLLSFTTPAVPAAHAASGSSSGSQTIALGPARLTSGRATVAVTCRSATPCQVRIRVTVNGRVVGSRALKLGGHRTRMVRIKLSRRNALLATAHRGATRVAAQLLRRSAYRQVASKRIA
jgi:hypothetical protein